MQRLLTSVNPGLVIETRGPQPFHPATLSGTECTNPECNVRRLHALIVWNELAEWIFCLLFLAFYEIAESPFITRCSAALGRCPLLASNILELADDVAVRRELEVRTELPIVAEHCPV